MQVQFLFFFINKYNLIIFIIIWFFRFINNSGVFVLLRSLQFVLLELNLNNIELSDYLFIRILETRASFNKLVNLSLNSTQITNKSIEILIS